MEVGGAPLYVRIHILGTLPFKVGPDSPLDTDPRPQSAYTPPRSKQGVSLKNGALVVLARKASCDIMSGKIMLDR